MRNMKMYPNSAFKLYLSNTCFIAFQRWVLTKSVGGKQMNFETKYLFNK